MCATRQSVAAVCLCMHHDRVDGHVPARSFKLRSPRAQFNSDSGMSLENSRAMCCALHVYVGASGMTASANLIRLDFQMPLATASRYRRRCGLADLYSQAVLGHRAWSNRTNDRFSVYVFQEGYLQNSIQHTQT